MVKVRYHYAETDKKYDGVNPADYFVVHETDNTSPGADADAHARLQASGNVRNASWHEQIDSTEAVVSFPPTTQCWHAGDGEGLGNLTGYAIEACVNPESDYRTTMLNVAARIRELRAQGVGLKGIKLHRDMSGKNCPRRLIAGTHGITLEEFMRLATGTEPITGGSSMHSPLKDGRVSSKYGNRGGGFHGGMDIAPKSRKSEPAYATFAGTIVKIVRGRAKGNKSRTNELAPYRTGNGLIIQNPDGEMQLYGHVAVDGELKIGQKVNAGQRLGVLDLSGNTTGYHVHYEEWKKGSKLNDPLTRDPQASFTHFKITPGADTGQGTAAVITPTPTPSKPTPTPTPSNPQAEAHKAWVKSYQGALKIMGYYSGLLDGVDGGMTKAATLAYQKDQNRFANAKLVEDGIWGGRTDAWYHWVEELQRGLNNYIGRDILPDGNYGRDTAARVLEVQSTPGAKRARLARDGIAGDQTTAWMRGQGTKISDRPR